MKMVGVRHARRDHHRTEAPAAAVSHTRSVARSILITGVLVLCAVAIVFPQSAAADTTLAPLPGTDPQGPVFVKYPRSLGKTQCLIFTGVLCGLNQSYPVPNNVDACVPGWGWHATHVSVGPDGDLEYSCGGNGFGLNIDPAWLQQLDFGVTYQFNGWTITPIDGGITFTNNATGHGMTYTTRGVNAY